MLAHSYPRKDFVVWWLGKDEYLHDSFPNSEIARSLNNENGVDVLSRAAKCILNCLPRTHAKMFRLRASTKQTEF